ncbi:MAG: transporter substrate-binding domain-containing protein [Halopseudomonas sp.]
MAVLILLCSVFLLPFSTVAVAGESSDAQQIVWMSEQYPPYNYVDDQGKAQGISVEILAAVAERMGVAEPQVEFLPWARAYALLQRKPQTALFSMTYTEERQQLFRFVGPIVATRVVLIAPRSAGLRVSAASDLAGLRIGVVRDDIGELLLHELGVDQSLITYSNLAENLVQLIDRGRVDAIAYSYDVAVWNMRKAGIDPQGYENVFTLLEGTLGFAFHWQTQSRWLDRLQQALEEVKVSGRAEQIRQKYLGQEYLPIAD